METAAIGATTQSQQTTGRGMESLQSEEFFQILISELQHQDPFKPTDTSEMVNQVSQIRSIELSQQLADALEGFAAHQNTSGLSGLIGKFVTAEATDSQGNEFETSGVVTGVRFDTGGDAILELDTGEQVPAANVTRITSPENADLAELSTAAKAGSADEASDDADGSAKGDTAKSTGGGLLSLLFG